MKYKIANLVFMVAISLGLAGITVELHELNKTLRCKEINFPSPVIKVEPIVKSPDIIVNVPKNPVNVDVEGPNITVPVPEVNVDVQNPDINVNVPEQPAPKVFVDTPDVKVYPKIEVVCPTCKGACNEKHHGTNTGYRTYR